jgi:CBS domain-containing protein
MKVKDVMTSNVKVVKHTDSVKHFLGQLEELEISGMPVVDADGRLLGVATMTDVGKGVQDPPLQTEADRDFYDEEDGHDASGLDSAKVADIMTEHMVTVKPETELSELAKLMSDSGIHRVFVTAGEEAVGVVTSLDMVRVLGELIESQMAGAS